MLRIEPANRSLYEKGSSSTYPVVYQSELLTSFQMSTSGGTSDRVGPGAAASTHSIRSHTTIFAARKPDGTLRREVKGKKRPFVYTAWAQETAGPTGDSSPHLLL